MIQSVFAIVLLLLAPLFIADLKSKRVAILYWVSISIREIFSFIHIFLFRVPGVGPDSEDYHYFANRIVEGGEWYGFSIGQYFYEQFLAVFYIIFGASELFGFQLSIFFFACSFVLLIRIIELLGLSKYKIFSLIIFSFLPTYIFLGSVTMPESGQVLFFMVTVYYALLFFDKGSLFGFIKVAISSYCMALFHRGLAPYAVLLLIVTCFYGMKVQGTLFILLRRRVKIFLFIITIFVPSTIILILSVGLSSFGSIQQLWEYGPLEYVIYYRNVAHKTRATYGIILDTSTLFTTFYTSIMVVIHYLFEPFIWKIEGWLDNYAFFESILRFILLVGSIS